MSPSFMLPLYAISDMYALKESGKAATRAEEGKTSTIETMCQRAGSVLQPAAFEASC